MALRDRLLKSPTIDGDEMQALVKSVFAWTDPFPPKDVKYLAPSAEDYQAFTARYLKTKEIRFGSCKSTKIESYPDCDDFVVMARGQLTQACVDLKLPRQINHQGLEYSHPLGAHDLILAFDKYRHAWFLEPQTGVWIEPLGIPEFKVRRISW